MKIYKDATRQSNVRIYLGFIIFLCYYYLSPLYLFLIFAAQLWMFHGFLQKWFSMVFAASHFVNRGNFVNLFYPMRMSNQFLALVWFGSV